MKEKVFTSAKELVQPGAEAATEFSKKKDQMVASCNDIFAKRTDLESLIGSDNLQMAKDNNQNFARFMDAVFIDFQPDVLVETVLWVFRAYRSHGFKTTYWAANLNIWIDVLKKAVSKETFNDLYPFYNWLIINIPVFVHVTESDIKKQA